MPLSPELPPFPTLPNEPTIAWFVEAACTTNVAPKCESTEVVSTVECRDGKMAILGTWGLKTGNLCLTWGHIEVEIQIRHRLAVLASLIGGGGQGQSRISLWHGSVLPECADGVAWQAVGIGGTGSSVPECHLCLDHQRRQQTHSR